MEETDKYTATVMTHNTNIMKVQYILKNYELQGCAFLRCDFKGWKQSVHKQRPMKQQCWSPAGVQHAVSWWTPERSWWAGQGGHRGLNSHPVSWVLCKRLKLYSISTRETWPGDQEWTAQKKGSSELPVHLSAAFLKPGAGDRRFLWVDFLKFYMS